MLNNSSVLKYWEVKKEFDKIKNVESPMVNNLLIGEEGSIIGEESTYVTYSQKKATHKSVRSRF